MRCREPRFSKPFEILPDDRVLARLKDVGFNPYQKAIVSRESLSDAATRNLRSLADAPAESFSAARISHYEFTACSH